MYSGHNSHLRVVGAVRNRNTSIEDMLLIVHDGKNTVFRLQRDVYLEHTKHEPGDFSSNRSRSVLLSENVQEREPGAVHSWDPDDLLARNSFKYGWWNVLSGTCDGCSYLSTSKVLGSNRNLDESWEPENLQKQCSIGKKVFQRLTSCGHLVVHQL